MNERKNRNPLQRLEQYQPSKTVLFWACAGSAIVAIVVGFSWGGWVTGGTAQSMADQSAAEARQQMAAIVCVDRFLAAPDAGVQLTALKQMSSSYQQGKFIEDGGWANVSLADAEPTTKRRSSTDDRKAAALCGQELAKHEVTTPDEAAQIDDDGVTVAQ